MITAPAPNRLHLVLAGGGHSHLAVLKRFGMQPTPGLKLTLVTRSTYAPYSGMLPGLIAGHYDYDACHIDLRRLARFTNADFVQAEVSSLDAVNRYLHLHGRPALHYDLLSLNTGAQSCLPPVAGERATSAPVKPVDELLKGVRELDQMLEAGARHVNVAVVGGGAGGVELILALRHRFSNRGLGRRCDYRLITDEPRILTEHNSKVRDHFCRILAERKVEMIAGERVVSIESAGLRCASGREIAVDFVIWAAGVAAPKWLQETGLELDARGFVRINAYLQSTSHANVFAAGDAAGSLERPLPKSGVYAVRQGSVLAGNLRRYCLGRSLKRYWPQTHALALISTGDRYAVGSRGSMYLAGDWLWHVKDRIDRRFVARYTELPAMHEDKVDAPEGERHTNVKRLDQPAMRCGGCGAKVGQSVLARVLERLSTRACAGIDIGLEAMDDAAVFAPPSGGQKLVQSIDYFRDFVKDPFLLGEIAANHALSDLYAMGAQPHSALAVVTLPFAAQSVMEEQLYQVMAGAVQTLDAAGATLLGGHSGEGAELAIGFSVTGIIDEEDLARRRMLVPGQALILTKPLGTGALFAADMRHQALGRWIDAAVAMMRQSNYGAAKCLRKHGATGCTDITGFGLVGHLLALLRKTGLGADIELNKLPLLEGALDCVEAGIFSSLQPQNLGRRQQITAADGARRHQTWPLLFDPQTSGGLLAAVPVENALACVAALGELGYGQATIVGRTRAASTLPLTVL
jgi:selenide, water dikinase